jgi:hypothetical protein
VHYRESSEYGSRLALASLAWPGRQKKSKRKRPCSLRRGGVGFPFFSLRQNRRGRSAGRRNVLVSALREPLGEEARAIRRSIAAIYDHGPGFLGRGRRLRGCVSQSQSSEAPRRRILVSAGRAPWPPEPLLARQGRGRRIQSRHRNASRRRPSVDWTRTAYNPIGLYVNSRVTAATPSCSPPGPTPDWWLRRYRQSRASRRSVSRERCPC